MLRRVSMCATVGGKRIRLTWALLDIGSKIGRRSFHSNIDRLFYGRRNRVIVSINIPRECVYIHRLYINCSLVFEMPRFRFNCARCNYSSLGVCPSVDNLVAVTFLVVNRRVSPMIIDRSFPIGGKYDRHA